VPDVHQVTRSATPNSHVTSWPVMTMPQPCRAKNRQCASDRLSIGRRKVAKRLVGQKGSVGCGRAPSPARRDAVLPPTARRQPVHQFREAELVSGLPFLTRRRWPGPVVAESTRVAVALSSYGTKRSLSGK